MELSVSMHAGSKKNAIKNLDKIKKLMNIIIGSIKM